MVEYQECRLKFKGEGGGGVGEGSMKPCLYSYYLRYSCTDGTNPSFLQVCETEEELVIELTANKATSAACIYFLLSARLKRYVHHLTLLYNRV